jgi:hypothetical protein
MRWEGDFARVGEKSNAYESLKRDNLKYLRVVGRLILEWIFKKSDGRVWAGFMWLRIRISGGLFLTR